MNCKNCQTPLKEEDEYCNLCGGKVIRNRLTFRNLFEHLSETFFNYDNKLLRTFTQLFKDPEDVIVGYINGVRKKYINPISFFGLSLTLSGLSIFIIKKFYIQYLDFSQLFDGLNLPEGTLENSSGGALEYNSLIYSALIPLLALISCITFLDKKYNYTEHVIIYLYSMSLLSIISVVLAQIVLLIMPTTYLLFSLTIWIIMFIYHSYILKRIFKLTLGNLVLKSIIALALFFALYIGAVIISFIIILILNGGNLEAFRPK
jgi:hypothetical protein